METDETQSVTGLSILKKRKHPRFSVDLPVEYYKIGSPVKHDGRAMKCQPRWLGLLYFSEPLHIGQYLSLKLFLFLVLRLSVIETIALRWFG